MKKRLIIWWQMKLWDFQRLHSKQAVSGKRVTYKFNDKGGQDAVIDCGDRGDLVIGRDDLGNLVFHLNGSLVDISSENQNISSSQKPGV